MAHKKPKWQQALEDSARAKSRYLPPEPVPATMTIEDWTPHSGGPRWPRTDFPDSVAVYEGWPWLDPSVRFDRSILPDAVAMYEDIRKAADRLRIAPRMTGKSFMSVRPAGPPMRILRGLSEGIEPPLMRDYHRTISFSNPDGDPYKSVLSDNTMSREDWAGAIDKAFTMTVNPCSEVLLFSSAESSKSPDWGAYPTILKGREDYERKYQLDPTGVIKGFGLNDQPFEGIDMAAKKEPMSAAAQSALAALAAQMNSYFTDHPDDCGVMLNGAATLTVEVPGKGYRKYPHVGGESFRVFACRVGSEKAGARLIFSLKPEQASTYSVAEMSEDEALAQLTDFRTMANKAVGEDAGLFTDELKRIRTIDNKAREEIAAVQKMDEYPEFGAW